MTNGGDAGRAELFEYLMEEAALVGADTDLEGCRNPNLALAARIALKRADLTAENERLRGEVEKFERMLAEAEGVTGKDWELHRDKDSRKWNWVRWPDTAGRKYRKAECKSALEAFEAVRKEGKG